jgi:hypothetical protein
MVSRLILGLLVNLVFVGAVVGIIAIPWGWFISSKYLHEETSGRFDVYLESTDDIGAAARDVANSIQGDIGRTPPRFVSAGIQLQNVLRDSKELYGLDADINIAVDIFEVDAPVELEDSWRAMQLLLSDGARLVIQVGDALLIETQADGLFPAERVIEQAGRLVDDAQDVREAIEAREQPDIPVDGALGAILLAAGLGLLLAVLSVSIRRINSDNDRRITLQRTGSLLIAIAGFLTLTFFIWPWLLVQNTSDLITRSGELVAILQTVGVVILGVGAVKTLVSRQAGTLAKIAGGLIAPAMAILAFFVFLRIGATSPQEHYWVIACIAIYLVVMAFFDLNVWSLHPWYRRQLRTAFGVKREGDRVVDLTDNELVLSLYTAPEVHPEPLICAAANVNEIGRTPTALNAVSFPFSAQRIGTPGLVASVSDTDSAGAPTRQVEGWIDTTEAERIIVTQRDEMSLLGAMAISGAAVSPGMGKMTLRSVQALLALANLRLGVWFPNPIWLNEMKYQEPSKRWRERVRATYLFKEVFGIYRQTDKFLYISDGGHWENLGLVELLRKRCTLVYCFDAAGDKTDRFKTLGEAIAIARTDLGIDFTDVNPYEQQSEPTEDTKDDDKPVMRAKKNVSVFRFTYADGTKGRIVYSKPVVTDDSSIDVKEYQEKNREFPAHSTLDQFFDHEQFEAYRMVGYAAGLRAAKRGAQPGLGRMDGTSWTRSG